MSKTTGTCIELKRKKIQKGTFEHIQRHTLDDMFGQTIPLICCTDEVGILETISSGKGNIEF